MQKSIEETEALLKWYQSLYSGSIYLECELALPEMNQTGYPEKTIESTKTITARHLQRSAELQNFFQEINSCQECSLGATRKNFVFGSGNPKAKLMFVGEAPGKEEDEQGLPFVGRAGMLLNKLLFAIGLNKDEVYIANVLKCRPPNNRDPLPDEILKCEKYLKTQLELIKPRVLVALGRIAGQVLLKQDSTLRELRQNTHQYENIPLIVTYHPAALLRNPMWKQAAWEDLKKIKKML